MKINSNNDSIYIGKNAGKEIMSRIKTAKKSVKIISPYLSSSYIEELIKLHKKGRKITLITGDNLATSKSPYSNFKNSDLINKKRIKDKKVIKTKRKIFKLTVYILSVLLFSLPLSFFLGLIYFTAILIIIFIVVLVSLFSYFLLDPNTYEYSTIFRIKVFDSSSGTNPKSKELIHSKIFVIDEELAFLGSANFTYSGFKKHHETTIKVKDEQAVEKISKEIENIYNSNIFREKPIEEWKNL